MRSTRLFHHLCSLLVATLLMGWLPASQAQATQGWKCPAPADLPATQLYGHWPFRFWALNTTETATPVSSGTLVLTPHPEYPGSVLGRIIRTPLTSETMAQVSGDLVAGTFNLDESADGVNVDAVWVGEATVQGCGREIRGMRLPVEGRPNAGEPMRFVLLKAAWH